LSMTGGLLETTVDLGGTVGLRGTTGSTGTSIFIVKMTLSSDDEILCRLAFGAGSGTEIGFVIGSLLARGGPARRTNSDDETVRRKPSPPASYPTAFPFSASLSCQHVFPRSRPNSTTSGSFKSSSVNTPVSDTFNFDFEITADVKSPNYECSTSIGFGEHCGGGHRGTLQPLNGPLILEPLAGSWSME
jgi:hypothetical protein